jgi:hypothetical protein
VLENLVGQRFGRLTVIARAESWDSAVRWQCFCDCGETSVSPSKTLKRGTTLSCGCLGKERAKAALTKHGRTETAEYRIWTDMKTRCYNHRSKHWKNWGGRGITVCDEWLHDFAAFFAHIGERPSREYSIDRINNDLGYTPGNVRWATLSQQNKNRRPFRSRH